MANVGARKPGSGVSDEERAELLNEVGPLLLAECIYLIIFVLEGMILKSVFLPPPATPAVQMEMLRSTIQDMEKERDFYFGKLRNIEVICQEKEGEEDPTLIKIMDILYATDVSVTPGVTSQNSYLFLGFFWLMVRLGIPLPSCLKVTQE